MQIIFVLIVISVVVGSLFLMAFYWATHHGQFTDLSTPSYRILFDDTYPNPVPVIAVKTSENTEVLPKAQAEKPATPKDHSCAKECKNKKNGTCKNIKCHTD